MRHFLVRWPACLLAMGLLGVSAPASADVTVIYAPPAPLPPLVAEVVPLTEVEAAREDVPVEPARPPEEAPVELAAPRAPEPPIAPAVRPVAPLLPEVAVDDPVVEEAPRPVRIVRVGDGSREEGMVALLDAEGRPSPAALTTLSVLARPRDADAPSEADLAAHADDLEWVASGIRRLHPGLLVRLSAIAAHFGQTTFEIVSGYRPDARDTSRHRIGRALDLRLVGVSVADLDAFASTLPETGVGLYPTTDFIHVDVRGRSAHWIDVSGPGEPPRAPERAPTERPAPAEHDAVDDDAILEAVRRGLGGIDLGR